MTPKQTGQYLAQRMATRQPMTKREMLRKWPRLASIVDIEGGIDWIEDNTATSDNPFLFIWDQGEARWGFRTTFGAVALNLKWNLGYLRTRMMTFEKVLDHAINSPVVAMTPSERRAAKAVLAQTGGTIAFINSMAHALP